MLAIALALTSSLVWGSSDFLGGVLSKRYSVIAILLVSEIVGLAVALLVALLAGGSPPALIHLLPAALAGLAALGGLIAFFRGLAVGVMSIVAPISATGSVIPVVVGLLGGNRLAALQLVGVGLAITGAVMAAREHDEARKSAVTSGAFLACLGALGFGIFYVGTDFASNGGYFLWATVATRVFAVPALVLIALVKRVDVKQVRPDLSLAALVGLCDVTANGLFAAASTLGLISLVGVLGALYPVATVFLAGFVLKERISKMQWLGVCTALLGVTLISA